MSEEKQRLLRMIVAAAKSADFYDLMRVIEQMVGQRFYRDAVEFTHEPGLAFPANDVARLFVDPSNEGERFRVVSTFLGLTGTASPLAAHFTEQVLFGDDEEALRTFYDVFHAQLLLTLYRSWRNGSLRASLDENTESAIGKRCATFVGIDPWTKAGGETLSNATVMSLADYQRGRPQSMDPGSAIAMLRRLFPTLPVAVKLGHRRLVPFGEEDVAELGSQNVLLGEDLVYGSGAEDASATVRIVVGPVSHAVCNWLMPEHEGHVALARICERVFGAKADLELEVIVASEELPVCELGGEHGSELGVDAWVAMRTEGIVRVCVPLGIGVRVTARNYHATTG